MVLPSRVKLFVFVCGRRGARGEEEDSETGVCCFCLGGRFGRKEPWLSEPSR